MEKIQLCLSFINEYGITGEINTDQIGLIGEALIQLQSPEEYDFNFFLIKLISESSNDDVINAAYLTLKNNFDNGGKIILKSFNPKPLANDNCFTILLGFLSLSTDDQNPLPDISYLLIDQIFELMPNRDFISIEIYDHIFDFISSDPKKSIKLFSSIILEVVQIDTRFYPMIYDVISYYIQNNYTYVGLFGLSKLLISEVSVPQELIQSCLKIFEISFDEQIISFILYIMMKLDEAPLFAFNRILEIIENYDSEISYIAIRLIINFLADWTDAQKEMLVDHLLIAYPNLYYKSANLAMYILLKVMKKLPSDPDFFLQLINGIEVCNYKPLSIACAQIIIRDWIIEGIDEEKLNLISDFQTILERLLNDDDDEIADISQRALDSLSVSQSEEGQ